MPGEFVVKAGDVGRVARVAADGVNAGNLLSRGIKLRRIRPVMITVLFSAANRVASSRPIPDVPPVMRIVLPESCIVPDPSCRLGEIRGVHGARPNAKTVPRIYHAYPDREVCQLFFGELPPRVPINIVGRVSIRDFGKRFRPC
jgi:hypothetical protein